MHRQESPPRKQPLDGKSFSIGTIDKISLDLLWVLYILGSVEKAVESDVKNDLNKKKKDKPPKNPESDIRLIFKSKILCYFLVVSIYIWWVN